MGYQEWSTGYYSAYYQDALWLKHEETSIYEGLDMAEEHDLLLSLSLSTVCLHKMYTLVLNHTHVGATRTVLNVL